MPILKENKNLYPKDWDEISKRIRKEAKQRCECCGVKNGDFLKNNRGDFLPGKYNPKTQITTYPTVVLTVAHIDHNPQNNDRSNLRALCQKCHNRHDMPYRAITRKIRKINAENSGRLELK